MYAMWQASCCTAFTTSMKSNHLLVFHSEVSLHCTERCDEEQEWR